MKWKFEIKLTKPKRDNVFGESEKLKLGKIMKIRTSGRPAIDRQRNRLKADVHSANFSRPNDTFCWRMFSFQSPFEEN